MIYLGTILLLLLAGNTALANQSTYMISDNPYNRQPQIRNILERILNSLLLIEILEFLNSVSSSMPWLAAVNLSEMFQNIITSSGIKAPSIFVVYRNLTGS